MMFSFKIETYTQKVEVILREFSVFLQLHGFFPLFIKISFSSYSVSFLSPMHDKFSEGLCLAHRCTMFSSVFVYFLIDVLLIYNAVSISAVQESGSVIHIDRFFIFFSIMAYHRTLSIVSLHYTVPPCSFPCVFIYSR